MFRARAAPLFLAASVAACHARVPRTVHVVFAADQLGYLSPCGCSEHQLGGAARAAAAIESVARSGPTLFVEGGNLLFGSLAPSPDEKPQFRAKALALGQAWSLGSQGAVRAFALGPYDRVLGDDFVRQALTGEPILDSPSLVAVGGVSIGLLPLGGGHTGTAAQLRNRGADLVFAVVAAETLAEAETLAADSGADLLLQTGVQEPVADHDQGALLGGRIPAFRVKDKGRGLLELTLHLPAKASRPGLAVPETAAMRTERAADLDQVLASDRARLSTATGPLRAALAAKIADLDARRRALLAPAAPPPDQDWADFAFVDLTEATPEDPAVSKILAAYNAQVAQENLAAQGHKVCPAPKPGELQYVGVESCRSCHPDAASVWDGTKHPHAYRTLVQKGRQYDVECIRCHVLGYDQPGGVCRLDQVGELGGVQCEACHGMGSAHVDSVGETPVPTPKPDVQTCLRCHTPDNDTRFSRETYVSYYLPRILGPGHGKPPKK